MGRAIISKPPSDDAADRLEGLRNVLTNLRDHSRPINKYKMNEERDWVNEETIEDKDGDPYIVLTWDILIPPENREAAQNSIDGLKNACSAIIGHLQNVDLGEGTILNSYFTEHDCNHEKGLPCPSPEALI